jgi:tripartite-type tricarboxylate transporter receptor subunit TctC
LKESGVNFLQQLAAILGMAVLCGTPASAWAQTAAKDYPNRPVRVIVPSPPGGPPDIIMRMLAPKLSAALGQPVVVENRAGAGGIVGTAFVAKAPPDGYTWLFTTASHVNIPAFNPNVSYDPVRDFTPVTMAAQNFGQVLIVNPAVPAKTVQELIAFARREPGKLTYGSAGIGTASHIPAEVMKSMTGTDILGVQYKGVAEAIFDLLAGRIDMFFVGTQLALSHVQNGRVRALAVTGPKRWKGLPEIPTMQQAGLKDFSLINWFGLWLPAGAAPEIVARLNAEMLKALGEADIRQQFDTLGLEAVGSKPDEFAKFVAKDAAFTLEVARKIQAAAK